MRAVVSQTLVIGVNGKRVALRETLPFTSEVRAVLLAKPPIELLASTQDALVEYGSPMIVDAQKKFEAGLISDEVVQYIGRNYGERTR